MAIAKGAFEVKLTLDTPDGIGGDPLLGRRSIDKHFSGDLQATSIGEMLSAGAPVKGSAVYVALEKVSGTLLGKTGTFVLYHVGVMSGGGAELSVRVAPDSGTGELNGISGTMKIIIAGGQHSYEFDYSIAAA